MNKKNKHPGGRPTKYNESFHPKLARALACLGRTDKQIALELDITEATLYNWKNEHPEFFEAIKNGKENPDELIENSLYKRALGYTFEEEKLFQHNGKAIRVPTLKHVPPDPTAIIFWLKNRRPHEWRDKHEIDHSGAVTLTLKDSQLIAKQIIDDEQS